MSRRHAARLALMGAVATVTAITALIAPASRQSDAAYPGANGRIAYAYGEGYGYGGGSIWSANPDGSAPTQLTDGAYDRSPSYSPNGSRIAFDREGGVAVVNSNGSAEAQLLEGDFSLSSKTDWESEYENPEDPSEKIPFVKITSYVETWHGFYDPSFSPDGSRLAVGEANGEYVYTVVCEVEEEEGTNCVFGYEGGYFNYEEECIECRAHIVTVDSTTGAPIGDVTPAAEGVFDYEPSYSSDGKIAFSRWIESSGYSIFVVGSPGSSPSRVTNGPSDYAPDFSPDGSRIAFRHKDELGLVGVGGGPITVLPVALPAGASGGFEESPAFSPDGSRIAFERTVYPKIGKTERGVYVMGTDGSGLAKVVDGSSPSWQPLAKSNPSPGSTPTDSKSAPGGAKPKGRSRVEGDSVVCGSSPCSLKVLSAKLKVGGRQCKVRATVAKEVAPGKAAKVEVKVAGQCLRALKKAGRGHLTVTIEITDAAGKHVLTLKRILTAGKSKKPGRK